MTYHPRHIDLNFIVRILWRAKWPVLVCSLVFGITGSLFAIKPIPQFYDVSLSMSAPVVPGFPVEEIVRDYEIFFHNEKVAEFLYEDISASSPEVASLWAARGIDKGRFIESQSGGDLTTKPMVQFRKKTEPQMMELLFTFPNGFDSSRDLDFVLGSMDKAIEDPSLRDQKNDEKQIASVQKFHQQVSLNLLQDIGEKMLVVSRIQAELVGRLAVAEKKSLTDVLSAFKQEHGSQNQVFRGFTFGDQDYIVLILGILLQKNLITDAEKESYLRRYFIAQANLQMGYVQNEGAILDAQKKIRDVGLHSYLSLRASYTLSKLSSSDFHGGTQPIPVKDQKGPIMRNLVLIFATVIGAMVGFCGFVVFRQSRYLVATLKQLD